MHSDLETIRNIGPAMAERLIKAGIEDKETLHSLGAHEAYRRMLNSGTKPHFISYYVLHMGLQGRPWNDCKGDEKAALRQKFDGLLNDNQGPNANLRKFLNDMGLL